MKKILVIILMIVCFAAIFSESFTYNPPKNSDLTSEGKWQFDTFEEYGKIYTTYDIIYPVEGILLDKIRIDYSVFGPTHTFKKERFIYNKESYYIPMLYLRLNTNESIYIEYEIIEDGKTIMKSDKYIIYSSDIPFYKTYCLNELDKLSDDYYSLKTYEMFIKPLVDALYLGYDIKFYIKELSGVEECIHIEGKGFGKIVSNKYENF